MAQLRITLVRHGQTGGQPKPGQIEGPLTPLGVKQAACVAKRLRTEKFDHIYTSDLTRAHDTALAIARYHKTTPLTVTSDIREVSIRHCQRGCTPAKDAAIVREQRRRVQRFCRRLRKTHRDGHVLVVAHGSLIGTLLAVLAGVDPKRTIPLNMKNTSVTVAYISREGYGIWNSPLLIDLCNCVRHLPPKLLSN